MERGKHVCLEQKSFFAGAGAPKYYFGHMPKNWSTPPMSQLWSWIQNYKKKLLKVRTNFRIWTPATWQKKHDVLRRPGLCPTWYLPDCWHLLTEQCYSSLGQPKEGKKKKKKEVYFLLVFIQKWFFGNVLSSILFALINN